MIKTLLATIGFLSICFVSYAFATRPSPPTPEELREMYQEPTDTVEVSAVELAQQYEDNGIAADLDYQDKWIQVTGKIQAVTNLLGDKAILLEARHRVDPIVAKLTSLSVPLARDLGKGDTVTLRCLEITQDIGSPTLSSCRL